MLFPASLAPPVPFPLVTLCALSSEFVAPGVSRAEYHLRTSSGPLVITLVAVDLREPTVRLDVGLAADHLVSAGETISAIATRTGAVAGINADYFDINGTNQPLNMVVRNGKLVRSPSRRAVLSITREREVRFDNYRFTGKATIVSGSPVPITGVNTWPPEGGASLLTPAYGSLTAVPGVSIASLEPVAVDAATPFGGEYRVRAVTPSRNGPLAGPALALGPAALRVVPLPNAGDAITIDGDANLPLADITAAVGGGPLLLRDGMPVSDPNAPAPEETNVRFPVSGAARRGDGVLLLVAVDGRQPDRSIGLTRPEFGALMRGLGAIDAMAFDSGGSATLVARVLGDGHASVRNDPSDGSERPVADGLFVYSDAPIGPASRLVVRPAIVRALTGTTVALRSQVTDAAGHPLAAVTAPWRETGLPRAGGATVNPDGTLHLLSHAAHLRITLARGTLRTRLPLEIVDRVTRLTITPSRANPNAGATVALQALGWDTFDRTIVVGNRVRWSASNGRIEPDGTFRAASRDARIFATAAGATVSTIVRVGRHNVPITGFGAIEHWTFATVPSGGPGSLAAQSGGTLRLAYDFRAEERAAYARRTFVLPDGALGLSFIVSGDANRVALRAQLVDWEGTRVAVTLARSIDWNGTRVVAASIPATLAPPVSLTAIYAVGTLGTGHVRANGTLAIGTAAVVVAGTP